MIITENIVNFDDASTTAITKVAKKPGGTFQSMGLARPILKAVERKGYKLATPIQRKCIPPIMTGRDVVAMARTGSGKTAAFLLPLLDKLKIRQPKSSIRALILSPTRELATQTFKFVWDFTKYTNLVSKLIIGGESINRDFETITSSPDILIATPGRLSHVLVEMKQKLNDVEIVVFDEADRLFEPGFKEMEQVNEICLRLPDSKQTLLFSATMPARLADFAKTGLRNPLFVRLDVESNLSETLKSIHLHCNQQDKFAILLYMLRDFVKRSQMTVVFMPTRHHIEYTKLLLDNSRVDCSYVYSSMDPEARRINIEKFTKKSCCVMLVTDIAARGIDIPLLDVVINFNFPFKPKLYVHRVGRVARAGRAGCAISLISHDETPYLHNLNVFLGETTLLASNSKSDGITTIDDVPDKILGTVPQEILDEENEMLKRWHEHNDELQAMVRVCDNAMKPYLKTRETPSPASVRVAKNIHSKVIGTHPVFKVIATPTNGPQAASLSMSTREESDLLDRIKSFKPQATIFEVGHIKGNRRTEAFDVMQKKRKSHDKIAIRRGEANGSEQDADESEQEMIDIGQPTFKTGFEDSKFYLKYQPDDYAKEKGLELDKNSFNTDLKRATMDLVADDEDQMKRQKHQTVWDRKRKKFVRADADEKKPKKIKTESGTTISASYQSGLFEKWKKQSKFEQQLSDDEADGPSTSVRGRRQRGKVSLDQLRAKLQPTKRRRSELKNPDEMLKERRIKEKREAIMRIRMGRTKGSRSKSKNNNRNKNSNKNNNNKSKGNRSRK